MTRRIAATIISAGIMALAMPAPAEAVCIGFIKQEGSEEAYCVEVRDVKLPPIGSSGGNTVARIIGWEE